MYFKLIKIQLIKIHFCVFLYTFKFFTLYKLSDIFNWFYHSYCCIIFAFLFISGISQGTIRKHKCFSEQTNNKFPDYIIPLLLGREYGSNKEWWYTHSSNAKPLPFLRLKRKEDHYQSSLKGVVTWYAEITMVPILYWLKLHY